MRYFSSKNIQSSGHLSGYFVEVSYHLVQARREMDLSLVAGPFGNHLATLFKGNSSIPNEQAELNERIAVLSAVLEEAPDEKGLQLYLARLYQARGDSGDLRKALACLQRATGPNAPALCWMLRIQLEKQFKGPERALEVCREGIDMLPVDKDVAQLYINYADLLAQAGKVEEAINSLKEAIGKIPPDKALADLYQRCADLLARAGKVEEAINLFKEAIGKIPPDKGLADLYVNYADLLARAGKVEEAINLFKEAIGKIPPSMGMSNTLFQHMLLLCAATRVLTSLENLFSEIDTKEIDPRQVVLWNVFRFQLQGAWKLAAETAHQGSTRFPTYLMLYTQEAFSWLCSGDAKEADVTLQRFPRPIMLDKGNVTGWLKALVALKNGDMQMARECLSSYLGWPPIDQKEITIDLLLRLWDTPPKSQEDYDIAYYYPRLPPSITGLPNEVARIPYGPPVLYD